jgi:transcriptional regulator of arginine metabolism
VRPAASLVVVKTPPAGAPPLARALDEAGLPEAIGAIAGDDTIFLATRDERTARALARRLAASLTRRTLREGA